MRRPLLRVEAIIMNEDYSKALVQCDDQETFYRFPGGSIEFGETAREAIIRELLEEYVISILCILFYLMCILVLYFLP